MTASPFAIRSPLPGDQPRATAGYLARSDPRKPGNPTRVIFCVHGVASPLLSNIYLHYVLDEWFGAEVQPRLRGSSTLIRYCDDFVMLFASKVDAERVLAVLGKRLGRYGLQLHPQKTRLVDFRFPALAQFRGGEQALVTTFNFLGFIHVWGRSRKGNPVVRQLTAKDRANPSRDRSTVSQYAAPADTGAALSAQPDAKGALRLLWHHR